MPITPIIIITTIIIIMDIIVRIINTLLAAAVLQVIRCQLNTIITIPIMTVNHVTVMDTVTSPNHPPLLRTIAHRSFVLAHLHHLLLQLLVAAVVVAAIITIPADATPNTSSRPPSLSPANFSNT